MSQPPPVPAGPCPDEKELAAAIGKLIDDIGAQNLTFRTLRTRLELQFNVNMTPYREVMDRLVEAKVMEPRTHKKMKEYKDAKAAGLVQTGSRKKGKRRTRGDAGAAGSPAAKGTRSKKEKTQRQDGEPKKPLQAYFLFANETRPKVKEANPSLSITEMASKIGELWAALGEEEKAKYKQLAVKDKERYDREMEAFAASGGKVTSTKRGSTKKAKAAADGPKKPITPYFAFLAARRPAFMAAHPELKTIGEIGTALGIEWKTLSDSDKSEFERIAEADRQRYERECAAAGISVKRAAKRPRLPGDGANDTASSSGSSDSDSSSDGSSSSSGSSSGSDSDSSDESSSSESASVGATKGPAK